MGIRFYCPNGHKLNVKSYLAGKRGICPHCGAKVLIPEKSVRPSSKEKREKASPESPDQPVTDDYSDAATEDEKTTISETDAPASEVEQYDSVVQDAASNEEAPRHTADVDPIAENPNAIWYVRPPTGHQYGPATGTVLQTWIDEGRIGRDTLVWREGWPSWLEAANVFPHLAKKETIDKPPKPGEMPTKKQTVSASNEEEKRDAPQDPKKTLAERKRAKTRRNLILVITLLLFTLAMMILLVYILQRPPANRQEEDASVRSASKGIAWMIAMDPSPHEISLPGNRLGHSLSERSEA